MKKILLLGGTGFVGRHFCEKLAARQWRVTVLTRRLAHAKHLQMLPLVDVIEIAHNGSNSLAPLMAGHDAVVNLVAILHGTAAAFDAAHIGWVQQLSQACHTAGLRRLVHVSALGASADAASMYQRSKAGGEAVLKQTGLDTTVLRPSVIFGSEDKFLNTFASLQQMLPVIPLAGSGTRFQPVWVEDVATALLRCLEDPATIGQTYEACGPDIFTLRELVALAGQYSGANGGQSRPIIGLPDSLARLQARLMELAPGQPLLSRDNLDSMKTDNVASGTLPGLAALGITAAALSAVAPFYLGAKGLRSGLMAKRQTAGRF